MPDFRPDDDYPPARPRRGRDARDDDRRDRDDRYGEPRRLPPPTTSVLGLLSVIGGVMSLVLSFIPCIGALSLIGGAVGAVLGGIGLLVARPANNSRGLPAAGVVVNLLSMLVAGLWLLVLSVMADKAKQADVETTEAIPISAAQLCREYDLNIVKADETYKGKVLEVTGQVKLVSKERIGRITVEIGSREDTIDCDFGAATRDELAGIEVGQTVTIRGQCKGVDRRSKYVVLERCKMAKAAPAGAAAAAALTADADALIEEYDGDTAAGDKAYKGKLVEVTGTVTETFDEGKKGKERVVQFHKEGKDLYLEFRLTPEATKAAGVIRPGRTITLKGRCAGLQDDDRYVLFENAAVAGK
ncbi:MAG TPA: hypothetical protein VH092_08995 [Urbifossiella sp.]|jgi:hypothetical protein|nr:hypothetical protein [Urbifossiella sp.]